MLICASPVLALLLVPKISRRLPIRFAIWVSTLGVAHEQLAQLIQAYLRSHPIGPASFVLKDGADRIAMHREAGHEVVIATGALESLARAICDSAGLEGVVVVGSSLRRVLGGLVADQHCFGTRKIPMLTDRGYPPDWQFVYTDHHADLPILACGRQRFLVNPRPDTITRVAEALGASPTVLMWK